jgi:lysine 2,3-aminomutase
MSVKNQIYSSEEWKKELLQSYTSVEQLLNRGLITPSEASNLRKIGDQFKIRITPYYTKLIENSIDCPIRKQAIPNLDEEDPQLPEWATSLSYKIFGRPTPWSADSIGDIQNLSAPRITHRYTNRAIIHLSSMCAVYCRFCFRKSHLNDDEKTLYEGSLEPAFQYLENHPEVEEVILTGGDPLSVTDSTFSKILNRLNGIKNVKTLRIHSRMPVTLPSRFTSALLNVFNQAWRFNICLVSHFNHPRELTSEAEVALRSLRRSAVTLLNQSVLLKGVNDSVECLASLFQGLYRMGVVPFYLHHPDWTPGTFHFRHSIDRGREIFSQLRGRVSGPALPDYILDIPQGFGKISLLDLRIKKLDTFLCPQGSELRAAIYELPIPDTLKKEKSSILYLDLFYDKFI